jgi:hypothetical protein
MGLSTPASGLASLDISYGGDPGNGTDVWPTYSDVAAIRFTVAGVAGGGDIRWLSDSTVVRQDNNASVVSADTLWSLGTPLGTQLGKLEASALSPTVIRVRWWTMRETDNEGFELERSSSATGVYQTVANSFVAGHGTTSQVQEYTYDDTTVVGGPWYYRLRQTDTGGTVRTSDGVKASGTVGVEEKPIVVPEGYVLERNYPNPFNPETVIAYQLAKGGEIRLSVYDILGREVAVLVSGRKEAGRYTVRFNASGMPSGLYLYRLTTPEGSLQHKMVLVK